MVSTVPGAPAAARSGRKKTKRLRWIGREVVEGNPFFENKPAHGFFKAFKTNGPAIPQPLPSSHKTGDMQPESFNTDTQYQQFIQAVIAGDEVWGLEGEEGLAISSSSNNDEQDVIPFWSSEALALAVAADDWAGFKPSSMSLVEFLENWLSGMHNDEILAGADWDASLEGKEVEPLQLALDLANAAEAAGLELEFSNYDSLADFRKEVKEASGL